MDITVAVVGNPNVGKSTLFNCLTGLSQATGNYPGVTVERKTGRMRVGGDAYLLIDLPGTYSLAARSPDETIVVDVLLGQQRGERSVDVILAVVDATNLERNLYLVSQLQETGTPLVVALNMMDIARRRGIEIDVPRVESALGVPVVPVCAHRREGIEQLREAVARAAHHRGEGSPSVPEYPASLTAEVDGFLAELRAREQAIGRAVPRVEAFRVLVDRDGYIERRLTHRLDGEMAALLEPRRKRAGDTDTLSAVEVRSRYAWIRRVVAGAVRRPTHHVVTWSDRIDRVLTDRLWGGLIFAVLMAGMFQAIYTWAAPLMDAIDVLFGSLGHWVGAWMPDGVLRSLVMDGVIAGVGSVMVFLPQILILALFIAVLEDCGYMARAAFLMDRLFSRCGLSGQSFIPMLSSFACAIPGIMATRIISERRDRLTTMLVAPLMSCSARLPIYTLMIAAFIPNKRVLWGLVGLQGLTLLALYGLGVVLAIPMAWLLKRTLLRGETPPFLLELPTYKWPQLRVILQRVLLQGKEFVRRAGTVICAVTVIVWALGYFPRPADVARSFDERRAEVVARLAAGPERDAALKALDREESGAYLRASYFARMGHAIEPAVRPLGWDWRIGMATLASFPAREIVVATMGTLFNMGSDVEESDAGFTQTLREAKRADGSRLFSVPVALSVMVFFALCCQCAATLAIMRRETGTLRWPAFTFAYMSALAYLGAFLTYQGATWLGWGG